VHGYFVDIPHTPAGVPYCPASVWHLCATKLQHMHHCGREGERKAGRKRVPEERYDNANAAAWEES